MMIIILHEISSSLFTRMRVRQWVYFCKKIVYYEIFRKLRNIKDRLFLKRNQSSTWIVAIGWNINFSRISFKFLLQIFRTRGQLRRCEQIVEIMLLREAKPHIPIISDPEWDLLFDHRKSVPIRSDANASPLVWTMRFSHRFLCTLDSSSWSSLNRHV